MSKKKGNKFHLFFLFKIKTHNRRPRKLERKTQQQQKNGTSRAHDEQISNEEENECSILFIIIKIDAEHEIRHPRTTTIASCTLLPQSQKHFK